MAGDGSRLTIEGIAAFDDAVAAEDEGLVPHMIVKRLAEGESPVRVWREHRGLTQEDLASRVGIRSAYLSQIENGKRVGSAKVLAALAESLAVAGSRTSLPARHILKGSSGQPTRGNDATGSPMGKISCPFNDSCPIGKARGGLRSRHRE